MGDEGKLSAVPGKANVAGFFIRQARRRQPLRGSPDSLAHGPREENLWKDHSPEPRAWKHKVCILCVGLSEREREVERMPICNCLRPSDLHCDWSVFECLRQASMPKSHKMAAA